MNEQKITPGSLVPGTQEQPELDPGTDCGSKSRNNHRCDYYKKSFQVYRRFLGFLKPYWKVGTLAGLLMIFSALLQIPIPLLTKYLIDTIVPAGDLVKLNLFALFLVGVVIIKNIIDYFESYLLIDYRMKLEEDIRASLFHKILTARLNLLEKHKAGYLESRTGNDVDSAGSLFMETLLGLVIDFLTFIVGTGLCFYLNVELAIVSLVSLPVFIISFHVFSKKMNLLSTERQEKWAILKGSSIEFISQDKTIKAFNRIADIFRVFKHSLKEALLANKKLQLYNVISSIAVGITGVILPLFVLWYGVRQIILGQFTLGGFIAFNSCIAYLYEPVKNFVSLNINIHAALAAAERIFEVLDYEEEKLSFGNKNIGKIEKIEIDKVTFFYPGDEKRGVENISLSLEKGKTIAITGATGKGKSTIARLLLGFDIPSAGDILINNENYLHFDLDSLRRRIGYVPQEPPLFSGSILDNILFFSRNEDAMFIEEITGWAVLDDMIRRLPKGMKTSVLESGAGLSGGEKQRIAIARALMRRPDILILDEATSAIDPETEARLIPNLLSLPWSPGILMISHRYTHLDKFDEILDLK